MYYVPQVSPLPFFPSPLSYFSFFLQCLQAMAIDHNDILAVIGDNFQLQDHVTATFVQLTTSTDDLAW